MENKRLEYIDVTKGIGIICVVLAHLGIGVELFYLFHMPLFFFISGFLFKPNINAKIFTVGKVNSLLIPYILFLMVLYPIQVYFQYKNQTIRDEYLLGIYTRFILGGRWLSGYVTVFWFITCLFFTQVFYNILSKYLQKVTLNVFILFLLIFSYINSIFFNIRVPWNLNCILFTIPIFHCGFLYKALKLSNWASILIVIIGTVGVYLTLIFPEISLDLKNVNYGIPFFSFIVSLSITIILIIIGKCIEKLPLSNIFIQIGESSLIVMYTHQVFNSIFKNYLNVSNFLLIAFLSIFTGWLLYKLMFNFYFTKRYFLGLK